MMAGDSRRIDSLVDNVGTIKGEVTGIRSEVTRVGAGVDELRGAMTVLSRHQVTMEGLVSDNRIVRDEFKGMEKRVTDLERRIGPVEETRKWTVQGLRVVIGIVLVAIVGLVVIKG